MSLCSVALPCVVLAQHLRFGMGAGVTVPTGDYGDADQAGCHIVGQLDLAIPSSPIGVRIDGLYGRSTHNSAVDGDTKLAGGLMNIVWHVPIDALSVKPYLLAGGGVFHVQSAIPSILFSTSETRFTLAGGVGVSFEGGQCASSSKAAMSP